jgi:hypothetical protein
MHLARAEECAVFTATCGGEAEAKPEAELKTGPCNPNVRTRGFLTLSLTPTCCQELSARCAGRTGRTE